jgi:hypothetical protein
VPYHLLRLVSLFSLLFSGIASAQTFKNPLILSTGSLPSAIAMADLNRDGNTDIVYAETLFPGGALHVLLGNGKGGFQRKLDTSLPAGVCTIACFINFGDINGDGITDIVLNGSSMAGGTFVAALLGNGDGTFQAPVISVYDGGYYEFGSGISIAIGDINGDHAMDLALLDTTTEHTVILLGDNSGHFHLAGTVVTTGIAPQLVLRDLNGDGKLDLIGFSAGSGEAFVSLGKGDGTFASAAYYTISAYGAFLCDADGDGIPDLLYASVLSQRYLLKRYELS